MKLSQDKDREELTLKSRFEEVRRAIPDRRVKLIYERYLSGRAITMDDLKYLGKKDPEGLDYLVHKIIGFQASTKNIENINSDKCLDTGGTSDFSDKNVIVTSQEYVGLTKDQCSNRMNTTSMLKYWLQESENNLTGLLNIHSEVNKLTLLIQTMNYWEDSFSEQFVKYTYEPEKEFNVLA